MTNRYVYRTLIGGLMTCAVVTVGFVTARAQDVASLPKGHTTVVGCYLHMQNEHHQTWYVLAHPKVGPATTVPNAACSANSGDEMLRLDQVHGAQLDHATPGVWMELTGKLGEVKSHGRLRKFDVKTFRAVPVETTRVTVIQAAAPPPQIARAEPPAPAPAPAAAPEPAPAATSGIEPAPLPKTASGLPFIALLGAISISAGFVLRLFDPQDVLKRG